MDAVLVLGVKGAGEWSAWLFSIMLVVAAILAFTTWWSHRKR